MKTAKNFQTIDQVPKFSNLLSSNSLGEYDIQRGMNEY